MNVINDIEIQEIISGHDQKAILALVSQKDFNPNRITNGVPLVCLAARSGALFSIQALANNLKTNLNAKNKLTGVTALHWAAAQNPEIGVYLLSRQADPMVQDNSGHYPLHYAAKSHHDSAQLIVDALLKDPRTDVFAKNNGGKMAFEQAHGANKKIFEKKPSIQKWLNKKNAANSVKIVSEVAAAQGDNKEHKIVEEDPKTFSRRDFMMVFGQASDQKKHPPAALSKKIRLSR